MENLPPTALDKEYEMLLDALGFKPATLDILAARSDLSGKPIASMSLILELQERMAPARSDRHARNESN